MYVRISETKSKDEKSYKYLKIEESYRDRQGRGRKRVLATLGRIDKLQGKLDNIVDKLRKFCKQRFILPQELKADGTPIWGPILVARCLWDKIGMKDIMSYVFDGTKKRDDAEEKIFLLVANRLHEPSSEHGLGRWLDKMYACYRGDRVMPVWIPQDKITKERRVRLEWSFLRKWYIAGDILYSAKTEIETRLYYKMRDIFSMKVDLVFYDITSTYFEVMEKRGEIRHHGYSRDEKKRNIQVLVGEVMVDGFPIASHVFKGNIADKTTVRDVVEDIERRFGIKQIIFVVDRGMVSKENIKLIEGLKHRYIIGYQRRRSDEKEEYLFRLGEKWQIINDKTKFQEVKCDDEKKRVFVVESDERGKYEEKMRKMVMEKCRKKLEKLKTQVDAGRIKKATKIATRADRIMQAHKGYRYFSYSIEGFGKFEYFEDKEKLSKELAIEGRYILVTNDLEISAYDAICAYKNLSEVEDFFRNLKDNLGIRPNYHKTDNRIKTHIFISHLALVLLCILKRILKEKGVFLTPSDAISSAETIGIAELDMNGEKHKIVSRGGRDARRVINALQIKDLNP